MICVYYGLTFALVDSGSVSCITLCIHSLFLSGLDVAAGMEDSELPNLGSEQNLGLDNSGPKLPDFANRPAGKYHIIMEFVKLFCPCFRLLIFSCRNCSVFFVFQYW